MAAYARACPEQGRRGGETSFWYDKVGGMRFSQTAQQALDGTYSYTKYDNLARIIEVGEGNQDPTGLATHVDDASFPTSGTQVTRTVYTTPAAIVNIQGQVQRNLENNVSFAYTSDGLYSLYSYDPHEEAADEQPMGHQYAADPGAWRQANLLRVRPEPAEL